jgi:glycosyltransferase involved in cell wall biosynthesis
MPGPRKPRLLSFVRALRLAGHEVGIVATADFSQGGGSDVEDGLAVLRELGVSFTNVPFALSASQVARAFTSVALRRSCSETALYDSRPLAERFMAAVEATHPDVVHVDRVRALPLVRRLAAPIVVDVTDPRLGTYQHYRRAQQLRPLRVGLPTTMRAWLDQRPAVREEASGLLGLPTLVASETGREMLLGAGADPAFVWQVPNAVFPNERAEPLGEHRSDSIVAGMSGNLSYPPNVLGFEALAKDVVPVLRRELGARIVVIGSSPHRLLVRAAMRAAVEIHADVTSVPETIRQLGVSVMVSPQRISTGFPNRVIDAIYRAGVPIVASPETVRGMPKELALCMPVAAGPDEWLQQARMLAGGARRDLVVELQGRIDDACGPSVVVDTLIAAYDRAKAGTGVAGSRTAEGSILRPATDPGRGSAV